MPIAVQRGIKFRRREALALFLGCAGANSLAPKPLARFFAGAAGGAMLLDVATRRVTALHDADVTAAPPGSTVKPFALAALLAAGKLSATESMVCPGKLRIAGRQLDCSHPALAEPMRVESAIAYSCNCFMAHVAERFAIGELAAALQRASFAHGVRVAQSADAIRLQALGEEGVLASAADLAAAYRWLALTARGPVLAGLEGAVEYGTAQLARVDGATTAGKTGTARSAAGNRIAWFGGFFPSRSPQVALAVMVAGKSGGGDAAPIAGRIFAAYWAGAL